jgi:spermidine/putrescine transport system substrate-binding protein
MSNEFDRPLSRIATSPTSRRRFIGGSAAAAAAAILGPSFLAACGSKKETTNEDLLRISNWPYYMTDGFVDAFQTATGIKVDYKEDFNDNEQWFAKFKEPLKRKNDIGADLVVPTMFMAVRLHQLGFLLNEFRDEAVPNKKNLRPELLNASADPGRKFSAPYMSGMVGLAYNKKATGREIKTLDDAWDPAYAGKVSLLSDMQDGLGLVMLAQGSELSNPTAASVQKAADLVKEQKAKGQIRRFTGNDYGQDLASGDTVIAQAYSGDVVQLQADNPDLAFIIPESGGSTFLDTMVIPWTTQNQKGAEAWINYVYDRPNYAKLIAVTQFVPVLSDMGPDLDKIDPALSKNPLINPPQATLALLHDWPELTPEQFQEFNTIYAAVTGA